MIPNATDRVTEEIIVRGVIDTLRAHEYSLTRDERYEVRELLNPYVDPEVITDIHMAVGLFHGPDELDPGPDLNATADSLFAHLCATNLITIGEALQLVLRSRTGDNAGRPRLHEIEPSYRFSRCPRLVA